MTPEQWRFADNARWLVVRAHRDAASLAPAVRQAISAIDGDQPIIRVATMDERVKRRRPIDGSRCSCSKPLA